MFRSSGYFGVMSNCVKTARRILLAVIVAIVLVAAFCILRNVGQQAVSGLIDDAAKFWATGVLSYSLSHGPILAIVCIAMIILLICRRRPKRTSTER